MTDFRTHTVAENEEGTRIDKLLALLYPDQSRSKWKKMIEDGHVKVGSARINPSYPVKAGEKIVARIPKHLASEEILPQEIPIEILYEDSFVIGVNKPTSMVVHPAPGHPKDTLVNALLSRYPDLPKEPEPKRAGLVHRLDKQTSGVMVVARTVKALRDLQDQFKQRTVEKKYLAVVEGCFEENKGLIEAPVGRSRKDKTKQVVTANGKKATTRFSVINQTDEKALLEVKPITGRTHQIRAHMNYIGHKILGDTYYGATYYERTMLHSWKLKFIHPQNGGELTVEAPIPEEFKGVLNPDCLPRTEKNPDGRK